MPRSASNANTVAPLDNAIAGHPIVPDEVQQQAMSSNNNDAFRQFMRFATDEVQRYQMRVARPHPTTTMRFARSGPTAMRFCDVEYNEADGQFRSSSGIVANRVISETGIIVDVPQRQSSAHNANQVISPDRTRHVHVPHVLPTPGLTRIYPRQVSEPTSEERGVIIIMPDLDRPFVNNGKPSHHECRHYHLLVAIGPFSTGACMRYYADMVAGRATTINAKVIMRPIHRTALPLLLHPDSVFFKLRKCSTCGHTSMTKKRCCKCSAHYCSVSCQLGDWPGHRALCKIMHEVIYKDPRRSPHNARLAIYQSAPLCPQFYMCTSIEAEELLRRARQIPESIIRDGNWMPGDEHTMLGERS